MSEVIDLIDVGIEVASAVLCFVLVKFMFKPYGLTKEGRYLGLPLGFAFLGVSEVLLGIGSQQSIGELRVLSLITRTFAFVFMATTYYFSKKTSKDSRLIWNITFSLLVVALTTVSILGTRGFQFGLSLSPFLSVFLRLLALLCISYICFHSLRSHIQTPEPNTIWTPLGFILLGISQYSLIIWASDAHYSPGFAFWGAIVTRFMGLSVFIILSYLSFCKSKKGRANERDSAPR